MNSKDEQRFLRDVHAGVRLGKWAAPIMIAVMVSVLGGTIKAANYFAEIVEGQSALAGRVSTVEAARLREADQRDREADKRVAAAKEAAAKLERQSNDIAVLTVLVRDVRDSIKDLRVAVRRMR
jgi:hypothetical protein